jgi:small subunit ribosomal protein S5
MEREKAVLNFNIQIFEFRNYQIEIMSKYNVNKVKAGDLELKDKVVAINRVVKTTKGGRAFSFSALVVVGNENGVVGHGLGKAKEVQEAITKGIEDAKKNLIKVPVMHGTIPHDQWAKEGAAKVLIKPAAHGTGVIAGGSMRAVLESAGVTDVLAKSLGSANPHNVVKATFKALALLREPINVAKTRSIGLKKVFNG